MALVLLLLPVVAEAQRGKGKRPRGKPAPAAARPPAKPAPVDAAAARKLGQAFQAYLAGDFERAYALAAPLADARLRNRDYALYAAAQSAWLLGDRERALPLFRRLAATPGSRFRGAAAWRVADCLWDLGRLEEARKIYERGGSDDPAVDGGVALFRVAEAHAAAGRDGAAIAAWRRLALEQPGHPLADRAIERLADRGRDLSARDLLARADVMARGRLWAEALVELEGIGDDGPEDLLLQRDFQIGDTLFRMRRQYARAGELLLRVHDRMGSRAPYALFRGARALSRADRDDEAIKWYREVVRKYPRTPQAAEAQLLSGWLEYNRGNFRASLPGLRGVLERYSNTRWNDDALWFLGFAHYMLGEHEDAMRYLGRLAGRSDPMVGGKARYWRARSLAAVGRADEATRELRALVGQHPFSWYALLARAHLKEQGIAIGPFGDAPGDPGDAPRLGAVEEALAAEPAIARADELIAAGLRVEAGIELRRGERELLKKYGSGRALPILLDRYRRAGNYNRPWYLATVYGRRAHSLPPDGPARAWWEHAFPMAYRDLVERHRGIGNNPEHWLYAIMWKETGFDPNVVSYADAIGLLQMIPPTTRRVAPQLGLEYTDDFLYDPDRNVQVASWYIGRLHQKFRGQVPLAAGSYNSGPRPVMRWIERNGERPMDEFIELVSYTQTREYMKLVTGAYARYLYLYAGQDYEQPLVVNREYLDDEITY
jgi:soluble lytic murein transglycosylase